MNDFVSVVADDSLLHLPLSNQIFVFSLYTVCKILSLLSQSVVESVGVCTVVLHTTLPVIWSGAWTSAFLNFSIPGDHPFYVVVIEHIRCLLSEGKAVIWLMP